MHPNLTAVAPVSNVDRAVGVLLADLRHSYGQVHALNGLTLDLAPGELVALLEPSGCGKIDGVDITMLPANKRDMGMLFQAYSLCPHMAARQKHRVRASAAPRAPNPAACQGR